MKKILTACLLALKVNSICGQQWMPVGEGVAITQGCGGASVSSILADTTNDLLYAAGYFDTAGSIEAVGVAKWDGSNWSELSVSDPASAGLYMFNNELYHHNDEIQKWDGSSWQLVDPNFNGIIAELFEYNGQLLAGGTFTNAGGTTALRLAVLDSTGEWQSFQGTTVTGAGAYVSSMAIYNGDLIIAGDFDAVDLVACNNIARWDGSQWHPLGSGTAGSSDLVISLGVYQGYLYASGGFTTAGGAYCLGFGKWDGNQWYEVDNSLQFSVKDFVVHSDELYAGGVHLPGQCIMKYNGVQWIPLVSNLSSYISSIDILDNKLYVGGDFHMYGATDTIVDIAMLDLITGEWQPVSFSEEIKVYPNPTTDKVYVSASLTEAKVSIINSLGQLVLQTISKPNEPIDVSVLPAGFYSLLLTSEKKRQTVSFVKQ